MDLELLTIGTELLLGFTVDTNAAYLARAVAAVGGRVVRRGTVGDGEEQIRDAVAEALRRTGFVITTGGLGPTRDDVTKKAVAEIFGVPFDLDEVYLVELRQRFESMGRGPMPASNRCQAEIPRGATVLRNRWGTAPGLWMEGDPGIVILLPGVPREMEKLTDHEVVPRIAERVRLREGSRAVVRSLTLRTTGIGESALAERIDGAEERVAPLTLGYLPSIAGVDLRLTAWGMAESDALLALRRAADALRPGLGPHYYGDNDADLAAIVLAGLRVSKARLAVAESCTGGMLGERITTIPGSSDVFVGGVIAYSNEVKTLELGVPEALLWSHGAVSEPVVREMVRGVTDKFAVDAGIAITGIAGPDGGSAEKPVGTVWIAAMLGKEIKTVRRLFLGGRQEVRGRAAQAGIDLLRTLVTRMNAV